MTMAFKIALRELRGGFAGVRIFLLCLGLGVASIAAVGSVREAIEAGMTREAAVILGGDAELSFTYRYAEPDEQAFMHQIAAQVSETVDFRSMAVVGDERGLTQVRGVDDQWPLYGVAGLEPEMDIASALAGSGGLPGGVMAPILADRLGIAPGDTFTLGTQSFRLTAVLVDEPDGGASGFALGPRTVVSQSSLETSGLLAPGTLFETNYRLAFETGVDLAALEAQTQARFENSGLRWRDTREPAPGVQEFVDRMASFLVLVGLAGLAVGGVGISASVRSYLRDKTNTIATLKTLGAETRTIFGAYLIQITMMTAIGLALGLALGAVSPFALAPLITARLPVPIDIALYPAPLLEAALYGALAAFLFTLWPLARSAQVRAGALYRDASAAQGKTAWGALAIMAVLVGALVGSATFLSGEPTLALGTAAGVVAALAVLGLAGFGVRAVARRIAPRLRRRPALRAALSAIGGPGSEAVPVVVSLGLGLWILATMGQIDANLRAAIARDLPQVAPSYFFVDIQPDQIETFSDRMRTDPAVSDFETAPMLRGVLSQINGRPAGEVAGNHWVVESDRGITYSDAPPNGSEVTDGSWWDADYTGPPLVAFAAEEAEEIGLSPGDTITVNVLGRDITAEIAALLEVDFSNAGIGFVLTFSPNALAGAPHTHIATVYADAEAEAEILREIGGQMPNVTAIRVRDAIERVTEALTGLAAATSLGAGVTLLTGIVVLIGAVAAGEPARIREASILKTLGATRPTILRSFAFRSAILGAAAGSIAVLAGALGAWAVLRFVMESEYTFEWVSALVIVLGGAVVTLVAGLIFALVPLAARPAQVLRASD